MLRNWLGNISERRLSNSVVAHWQRHSMCVVCRVCVREWASHYNSQWMFFHWTDAVLSFSWFSMSWKCWTFRSFPILYVIHYIIYMSHAFIPYMEWLEYGLEICSVCLCHPSPLVVPSYHFACSCSRAGAWDTYIVSTCVGRPHSCYRFLV